VEIKEQQFEQDGELETGETMLHIQHGNPGQLDVQRKICAVAVVAAVALVV